MSTRPVRRRRLRSVALLVAVLGGLFLMHGLGSHGATHHAGAVDTARVHARGVARADAGTTPGGTPTPDLPVLEAPGHEGGPTLRLAELCLAVFVGGLLLALLTRRGGRYVVARRPRTRRASGRVAFAGHPPDPPALWRLSVCRC